MTKENALAAAKNKEAEEQRPYYVVYNRAAVSYEITTRMPMLGEWYTADGIGHG